MKKAGKYISISLLLLLGLCCVGILYLFFIPNATLFNITYINHHKTIKSENYAVGEISKIDVNSRAYDVKILTTDTDYVYSKVYSNSFGFVLKKNSEISVDISLTNKVLTINVNEPHGFATKNDSYVAIYIPENHELDLDLSNIKAKTIINDEKIKIKNLTYSTENGDFEFNNGTVLGDLNLDINKSTFSISENVATNSNKVNLQLTKGKFYATKNILGDVSILKSTHGVISIKECGIFHQETTSAGGSISIEKASRLQIQTSDTNISVGEVTSGASVDISESGKIHIEKLSGYSVITTNSGNVQINNCNNELIVHTASGNITINNAVKIVRIKTNSGNATVNFSESAPNYSDSDSEKSRTLYATIENGNLSASGVQHVGIPNTETPETITGITITGNGNVSLNMQDVLGRNEIDGNNGNVSIIVNDTSKYMLTTSSQTGDVRVNLLQIPQSGGYKDKTLSEPIAVNCTTSENTFNVKTTGGNLTMLDESMYKSGF